jgi:dimethylargininase
MLQAITRQISRSINQCELTHIDREPIDLALAREQHRQYETALKKLGCNLTQLPEEPNLPDSVFVEDIAVVFPEVALITNPGTHSRVPERKKIAQALKPYRMLVWIEPPATVDGGDVLVLDKDVYIGLSSRSNQAGVEALQDALEAFGYRVHGFRLVDCLHLKSAVTRVGPRTLLLNPDWIAPAAFPDFKIIQTAPGEAHAANGLLVDATLIYPAAFPKTAERLRDAGIQLEVVDVSELAKAEGAVTCCSLVFKH